MPVKKLLHHFLRGVVLLHQVLPVQVPILRQRATHPTVHNLKFKKKDGDKTRLCWHLFRAGVAVVAGGGPLLLDPVEPVDLLEPLGHFDHLGEAASHVGHLGHPLAARVNWLLMEEECRPSFYTAWQCRKGSTRREPTFLFFPIFETSFCLQPNQPK